MAPDPATSSAIPAKAKPRCWSIPATDIMFAVWRPWRRVPTRLLRRLPARVAVPVLSTRAWPRAHTEDVRVVAVPAPYRLEAYWLRIGEDEGPALSLFFAADEVLRVDCLGERGHIHYGLAESRHRGAAESRVYLPPSSVSEQIDRATFELARNVAYCTGLHRLRSVRATTVDAEAFAQAADEVGAHLHDLLDRRT
jgi:hypothetical protein